MRKSIAAERAAKRRSLAAPHVVNSFFIWLLFVILTVLVLAVEFRREVAFIPTVAVALGVVLISLAAALY
ncbi:MAG: hypothetical protein WC962_01115, partial [Phycisphaerae bacterium]